MKNLLEARNIPSNEASRAVAAINDLSETDQASLLSELTGGLTVEGEHNLLMATKYAVQAVVILGENATAEKVAANVQKKYALNQPNTTPVAVVAAVEDITATEVVTVPEATETESVEAEATESASDAPSLASLAATVPTVTGRRRGRPKLAETGFDRAKAILSGSAETDRTKLAELLVANGFKLNSAKVYVWKFCNPDGAANPRPRKAAESAAEADAS